MRIFRFRSSHLHTLEVKSRPEIPGGFFFVPIPKVQTASRYFGVATRWGTPRKAAWSVLPKAPYTSDPQQYAAPSLPIEQL